MEWAAEDDVVAEQMMEMWTNFARTGNPSIPTLDWPEYSLDNDTFVEMGPQGVISIQTGLEQAVK